MQHRHAGCIANGVRTVRPKPRLITLLDLLSELQRTGSPSEQALVAMALDRILTGRVVLCGIFSLDDHHDEPCCDIHDSKSPTASLKH